MTCAMAHRCAPKCAHVRRRGALLGRCATHSRRCARSSAPNFFLRGVATAAAQSFAIACSFERRRSRVVDRGRRSRRACEARRDRAPRTSPKFQTALNLGLGARSVCETRKEMRRRRTRARRAALVAIAQHIRSASASGARNGALMRSFKKFQRCRERCRRNSPMEPVMSWHSRRSGAPFWTTSPRSYLSWR